MKAKNWRFDPDIIFVLDNFNIVPDKKYFVQADGQGNSFKFLVQFTEFHLKPIDGTEATHPLKTKAPFEMIDKGVKYTTLLMPENHNSVVHGAIMKTPTNGIINIVFPMVSQDEGPNEVGRKEKAKEWKIFLVPLTKTCLDMSNSNSELEVDLELVKRRWQQNIQIVSTH